MEKLTALVSDFDDTLFFNRSAIVSAAEDLYSIIEREKEGDEDYKAMSDLEITAKEGRIPKGFSKKWKNQLYTFAYAKYNDKLSPNNFLINYLNQRVTQGDKLIILSARGEEFRKQTEGLLNRYGVKYDEVILPENHRLNDEEWKLIEVRKLIKKYSHLALFEDKFENIQYIANGLGINENAVEFYLVNHSGLTRII